MNALNRSVLRAQSFCYSTLKSVTVKSWPTIDNPWRDKLDTSKPGTYPRNFLVSKEEFKYVEMLKPQSFIPLPPPGVEITPSGWIPPRRKHIYNDFDNTYHKISCLIVLP